MPAFALDLLKSLPSDPREGGRHLVVHSAPTNYVYRSAMVVGGMDGVRFLNHDCAVPSTFEIRSGRMCTAIRSTTLLC